MTLYNGDQTATIQYGVVNDELMVGLGDGISTLAQQPAESLADNPGYQAALAELPQSYSSVLYVDLRTIAQEIAPYLIETLASDSNNPIVQCLAQNTSTGSPVAATGEIDGVAGAVCSLIGSIFGENTLQDFVVSRVPGPIAAVAYRRMGCSTFPAFCWSVRTSKQPFRTTGATRVSTEYRPLETPLRNPWGFRAGRANCRNGSRRASIDLR